MNQKVYVVEYYRYEFEGVSRVAIFSTREKAEAYRTGREDECFLYINEVELDHVD